MFIPPENDVDFQFWNVLIPLACRSPFENYLDVDLF